VKAKKKKKKKSSKEAAINNLTKPIFILAEKHENFK
jgi:hypothetical protein